MIEKFVSIQDMLAIGFVIFIIIKWIQRKEKW